MSNARLMYNIKVCWLFYIKKPTNAHLYCSHHFVNAVLLKHVSASKGPTSGITTDKFSQPDQ